MILITECSAIRYGEKMEEIAGLEEWVCPKCRGICNCSVCMKRRGHQPTSTLINAVKESGFSCVSEILLFV
ncbi:Zinc-finger domain of monoamine-oxidase A repressor R1 protein [Perilla frutescens var. hirtella]|nr:Zinc-finger domain of monoamine-oxidase A repressor R1 protein [Perilla frutescens var. hirtella]